MLSGSRFGEFLKLKSNYKGPRSLEMNGVRFHKGKRCCCKESNDVTNGVKVSQGKALLP